MSSQQLIEDRFAHNGQHYSGVLTRLARVIQPRRYFEIGTRGGQSLRQFMCDSIAVDPRFNIHADVILTRKRSFFFQMTSDAFFAQYSPKSLFGDTVDLAFLDGFHRSEFLLRDIINIEPSCHAQTVIILHDCLPPHPVMGRRSSGDGEKIAQAIRLPVTEADLTEKDVEAGDLGDPAKKLGWAGDVFRTVFALKKFRPDLRIHFLDCPPTGLVVISRVSPDNSVLRDSYFDVIDYMSKISMDYDTLDELFKLYPWIRTKEVADVDLSMLFPTFS